MEPLQEQLQICKKCSNRTLDFETGLLCNLTGLKPSFDKECNSFAKDETILERQKLTEPINALDGVALVSKENIKALKKEQNLPSGIIAGIIAGLVGAFLWAAITVATEYQIGFMAIGVGAGVGLAIRFAGKGIDQIFGISGAIIAILGCLLGNFFSIIGFISKYESLGYFETLLLFNYSELIPIMSESFNFMDLVFYGIAAYEGYKFAFRTFTEEDLGKLNA